MSTVIVNGLFVGLIYALLGVGLVVVYRSSRVINFAFGETGMLAAFVFAELRFGRAPVISVINDRGLVVALPVAILVGVAAGAATEFFVIRPLRHSPRIQPLVGTFAVAGLLVAFAIRRWGTTVRYAKPLIGGRGAQIAGITISPEQWLILAVTVIVLVGLWALYRFTRFGLALRAVAIDPKAAGLVGVNVNLTSLASWALGGALAGIAGILVAPIVAFDVFFMATLTIRGLAAGLVGGLTNIWGAVVAGLLIGVVEGVIAFKSPVTGITDVAVAVFVLVLMLARPQGLIRSAY